MARDRRRLLAIALLALPGLALGGCGSARARPEPAVGAPAWPLALDHPSTRETHREAVEDLLAAMRYDRIVSSVAEGLAGGSPGQPSIANELVRQYVTGPAMRESIAGIYLEMFTELEIRQLIAFYATPVGRSSIERLPEIAARSRKVAMDYLRAHAAELRAGAPGGAPAPTAGAVARVRVSTDDAPSRGASTPLVRIVIFSDFECPFCSRMGPTLEQLFRTFPNEFRLYFRHNPLPMHPHAMEAAEAAVEAREQGGDAAFWRMHDLLFASQRALDRTQLDAYAAQIGLDVARFGAALDSDRHVSRIRNDVAEAQRIGARGTPIFFVNGRPILGAHPHAVFETAVREEIDLAAAALRSGVRPENLYDHLLRDAADRVPPDASAAVPRRTEDPDAVYRVPVDGSPAIGSATALVTIVEFADFECPFCERVRARLDQLRTEYGGDLRIVFKHGPLPFHPHALEAAEAAAEARAQRGDAGFWRMHNLLFDNRTALARADLERYASQIGLDGARFRRALDGHAHRPAIERDLGLARLLGATGTPIFFVNGRKLRGAQPIEAFRALVDRELRAAREIVARGTPRNRVYETVTADGATSMVLLPAAAAP